MYAFIDDSGDAGMKFRRGSSRYLVMAMCLFPSMSALVMAEEALAGLPDHMKRLGEFKHAKMKERHREEFFTVLVPCDFSIRTVIVDKSKLTSQFLATHASEMKTYFIMRLLTRAAGQINNGDIVIDGADLRAFGVKSDEYLLSRVNQNNQKHIASRVDFVDSRCSAGLQIADMVAGTVMSGITKGEKVMKTARWKQVLHRATGPEGDWWLFPESEELRK